MKNVGSWGFFPLTIIFMLTSRLTLSIKTSLKMGYELKIVFWTMNIKKRGGLQFIEATDWGTHCFPQRE